MISSTLGAPLGGTTVGGQPAFESTALRLTLPAKGGGGFGIYLPPMVVVARGEPGVPVVWTCARRKAQPPAVRTGRQWPIREHLDPGRVFSKSSSVFSFEAFLGGA